jgi:phytoene synthase
MVNSTIYKIFKTGSKTFFTTSLFFPSGVRDDVFIFYSFVRVADDLVDSIPAQIDEFNSFKENYRKSLSGVKSGNEIIDLFVEFMKRKKIPPEWIEAFLHSMTLDTYKKNYRLEQELSEYLYGSAEVVGLVMCKILDLPTESYNYARLLGRAFQYINFIRDIAEDNALGRCYFGENMLSAHGLKSLAYADVKNHKDKFYAFMKQAVEQYIACQNDAEKGFAYIPKRYLIPIKAAADVYRLTAKIISKDPLVVFKKKIKPNKIRIVYNILYNCITL